MPKLNYASPRRLLGHNPGYVTHLHRREWAVTLVANHDEHAMKSMNLYIHFSIILGGTAD